MAKGQIGGFFFTIGGKMSAMTLALLLAAAIPIAVQTAELVKKNSGRREESSNSSNANSKAAEINGLLESYVDKLSVIGTLMIKEGLNAPSKVDSAPSTLILGKDKDIASFEIYSKDAQGKIQSIGRYTDDRYLKGYKLTKTYLDDLNKTKSFPVEALFSGQPILRNRSVIGSAPIITLGVPVASDSLGRVSHVAVADLPLAILQRGFSKVTERTVFLVDKGGNVMAHSADEKAVMNGGNLSWLPIVKAAITSKVSQGQLRYQNSKKQNETFIAAFSKALFDLVVISEASEKVILEPAMEVQRKVYQIAGIAVFAAFLIVSFFSMTLTRPLGALVDFTAQVAKGNFNVLATSKVKSRDEVGTLAYAFDGMTHGLKERDKVKNLMNKFHGKAATNSLLEFDNLTLGGQRKKIVVFFSDIRGFTAFSENKSPEQVVSMLNEYFQEMVQVIYSHGGEVDKFIGDAVMAHWGAQSTTNDDAVQSVKACIGMRIALAELNKKRVERGDVPIKIGMGLHSGEAICGTIGSNDRMELTVIGDTVNMASRIESSTKAFGTDLLLSEDIAGMVAGKFILDEAGSAEVKGKSEPLKFYKVKGYIDAEGKSIEVRTEWSEYEAEKADKVKIAH